MHVHDAGVDAEGGVIVLDSPWNVTELREDGREVIARVCKVGLQLERRLHRGRRVSGLQRGLDEQGAFCGGETARQWLAVTENCCEIRRWAMPEVAHWGLLTQKRVGAKARLVVATGGHIYPASVFAHMDLSMQLAEGSR